MSSDEKPAQPKAPKRGDAPRSWPNTTAAAARTGLNRRQLEQLAERGALKVEKDSMGVWRWDPDMLALVAAARENDDVDDVVDDGGAVRVRSTGLAEAVALLKQSHSHNEQVLQLVRDPMRLLLERYTEDNKALRERVAHLESRHDELIAAREKYLSEQHLRDMLQADQDRQHARKDKALALVSENVPKLLAAANPEAQTVVKLLRSLNADQRDMLLLTDLLSPEQKAQVRALVGDSPPAPASTEAAE